MMKHCAILALTLLSACSAPQLQTAQKLAPVAVQTAVTIDPKLKSSIAGTCAATVAATDLALAVKPTSKGAQVASKLAHAGCDTEDAQAQLVVNDQAPVQPDGGSSKWLAALAIAAKIAVTVAPLL